MNTKTILIVCIIFIGLLGPTLLYFKNKQPIKSDPLPPEIKQPEQPIEPPPKEITMADAVSSITSSELEKDLGYLASDELEGRMSGKKGNIVAAEFIKSEFEKMGLQTMYHKFRIERMNPGPQNEVGDNFTQNIYAWIDGTDPALKDEIVVIGAHMDHIGYGPRMSRGRSIAIHPGADDNASGTVALLEIAEAFSMLKGKLKRTVVFQAYSGEEMGLLGSRFYCDNPVFPQGAPNIKKHIAMINMDMVGWLDKGRDAPPLVLQTAFVAGDSSTDIGKIVRDLNTRYMFAAGVTSQESGGSDHASFYNKHVPIAFLHTGTHQYYHTPGDSANKINYTGIEQVAKYGFELAITIVNEDTRPEFNMAEFKAMDYTHDHNNVETPFEIEGVIQAILDGENNEK